MVLDARSNNLFGKLSNLQSFASHNQTVSLEGDFDQYFTLYAPENYQTDARYIFTPNVMQTMIDSASQYDVEIIDNNLYLYSDTPFTHSDESILRGLLETIEQLRSGIWRQTDRYKDAAAGSSAANVVAPEARRLKTGMSALSIVTIVLTIAIYLIYMFAQF